MIFSVTATASRDVDGMIEIYPVPRFFIDGEEPIGMVDVVTIARSIIDPAHDLNVQIAAFILDEADVLVGSERLLVKAYRGACETCSSDAYDSLVECGQERLS